MVLVPQIYFYKWVAIDNKMLGVPYFCMYITMVILVIVAASIFQVYVYGVEPTYRLALWGDNSGILSAAGAATSCSQVSSLSALNYEPTGSSRWSFKDASCAQRCGSGLVTSLANACISDGELVREEGDSTLFFATAFNEEISLRYHGSRTWYIDPTAGYTRWLDWMDTGATGELLTEMEGKMSNATLVAQIAVAEGLSEQAVRDKYTRVTSPCPFSVDAAQSPSACASAKSYAVPDMFLDLAAKFSFEYQVTNPGSSSGTTEGMTTIVKNSQGSTLKEAKAGETLALSVKEAMDAAGLSFAEPVDASIPDDKVSETKPLGQAVGMDIGLYAVIGNTGEGGAPVCEITIKGQPAFMMRKEVAMLDAYGSTRVRTYSGVRFTFHARGNFYWFRSDLFFYNLSLCASWLQLPGILFFAFALKLLGTLSEAYRGYCLEHVDMSAEVNGSSARTLAYSYGTEDLSDLSKEDTMGMSHMQVKRRLMEILASDKAMGPEQQQLFIEFFFDNSSAEWGGAEEQAILPAGQLEALNYQENLRSFQDVITTVDPDGSNRNALEYVFTDDTVNKLRAGAEGFTGSAKNVVPHDTTNMIMNRLNLHSSLWVVQRCNLFRCKLGQSALREQVSKLSKAGERLADFATKLEGRF
eukprot:TRINITY_DN63813_c0_g1_i1.p1 TRINITY_DN63813_c0_g1~~TRINITY_DN63813_c0_g1_i1.p1  ORF type:complete len:641 (+),score=148.66 TRINITY_DN63813_c0_g1_i1:99-2021(+)